MSEFTKLREELSPSDRTILDSLLTEETRVFERRISDAIRVDRSHLDLVNFCSNFFTPGSYVSSETGYKLMLIEPMYELAKKNFDLAIFRIENNSLILVECKSSISKIKNEITDIEETIRESEDNISLLEDAIGNPISLVEYVICLPLEDAMDVANFIMSNNISLITWGVARFQGIMKMICSSEEMDVALTSGRAHRDSNLRRLLNKGINSGYGLRSFSFLPSSHICTILVHVGQELFMQWSENERRRGEFQYPHVFRALSKEFEAKTTIRESDFEKLTLNVIHTGQEKGLFIDLNEETDQINRKYYRLSTGRRRAEAIREQIEKSYIEKNARIHALDSAVTRFYSETGRRKLNSYLK